MTKDYPSPLRSQHNADSNIAFLLETINARINLIDSWLDIQRQQIESLEARMDRNEDMLSRMNISEAYYPRELRVRIEREIQKQAWIQAQLNKETRRRDERGNGSAAEATRRTTKKVFDLNGVKDGKKGVLTFRLA